MSDSDRLKWDARYAEGAYSGRNHPSDLLRKYVAQLASGKALDLACGAGRNALFLAGRGWAVDAIDVSTVGLGRAQAAADAAGLKINWLCQDLLMDPVLPAQDYQLIIMFRFVAPQLLKTLPFSLAPGGMLMVEEHMVWPTPVTGPTSNRFRVAPGSLQNLFPDMDVVVETEGEVPEPDGTKAAVARLLVQKPA